MDSKRITFSNTVPPTFLPTEQVDIQVPAGDVHYHLEHTTGERFHTFYLTHPNTQVRITGKVETDDISNLSITLVHQAPHTKAETIVRTLGRNSSKSIFRGLIKIAEGAAGCESYLNHHSLLFEEAHSWSWPALEIGNNDVKCSHAATVKTITPLDLFYARSRGIVESKARALMIEAFFADVAQPYHA
jgi:Fe-S cluster assembly scaffold protein SufB